MNAVVCPGCCGEGECFVDYADRRGEHMTRQVKCEQCGGTGEVEAEAEAEVEGEGEDEVEDEVAA